MPDTASWNVWMALDAAVQVRFVKPLARQDVATVVLMFCALTPPAKIRVTTPFANDGSKPSYYFGRPNFGFTVIKKGIPEARIKMLLHKLSIKLIRYQDL